MSDNTFESDVEFDVGPDRTQAEIAVVHLEDACEALRGVPEPVTAFQHVQQAILVLDAGEE